LTQAGTGTTHLQVNNTYSGTTTISAGTLVIESPLAMQNSSLTYNIGDGTLVFGDTLGNTAATGATIGSLAGNRDIALMNNISDITLTVGGNGATTSYTGILSDSPSHLGALVKAGAGTMTLTAAETYGSLSAAVTTTVTGGILIISPTASLNGGGIQANAGAGGIQNTGGTITVNNAANSAFQGGSGGYTQTAGTANFGTGTITLNNNSNNVALLGLSGGSFTAANMNTTRCSLAFTAEPAAGSTTDGVYVSGTATVHFTGTVNVGTTGGNNNSGVSMRTDGGTTTVDGPLTVQLNNQGRWSILDVNGGSLTVGDVNTGVQLGGTSLGQAVFQMRAGTATVGRITFGAADNANDGVLNVTGGTLYVGSGGMARGAPGGTTYNAIVRLGNGTIGAAADWSAAADINANNALTLAAGGNVNGGVTINGILLNGDATTGITFKAADAVGTPHNITINAPLTGAGALTKTGLGILTLTAANTNTGNMNVNQGTLLLGASNTIATTPRVNLNGGTLNTDGLAQAITSTVLHASATSTLDFGDSLGNPDTVQFSSNTASDTWTAGAFLRIANWTSTSPLSGGGPDKLFAGAGGLSSAQLSHIHFSPYKTGSGAQILSSGPNAGEVVPLSTAIVLKQGDLNQDTHTNVSDVGALMATLSDVPKYANGLSTIRSNNSLVFDSADMLDLADLSNDNLVNNLDVQSLINILANGGGSAPGGGSLTAVPEPSSIVLAGVAVPALAYALRRRAVGRKSA